MVSCVTLTWFISAIFGIAGDWWLSVISSSALRKTTALLRCLVWGFGSALARVWNVIICLPWWPDGVLRLNVKKLLWCICKAMLYSFNMLLILLHSWKWCIYIHAGQWIWANHCPLIGKNVFSSYTFNLHSYKLNAAVTEKRVNQFDHNTKLIRCSQLKTPS